MQQLVCEECENRLLQSVEGRHVLTSPSLFSPCRPPLPKRAGPLTQANHRELNSGRNRSGFPCFAVQNTLKVLAVPDSKRISNITHCIFQGNVPTEFLREAANGVEALELTPRHQADILTLDIDDLVVDRSAGKVDAGIFWT